MEMKDYLTRDACALAAEIKSARCDQASLIRLAMERCEQIDPLLNVITHRFEEKSHAFLNNMQGDEPFYGVPLLVKELGFSIAGEPCRYGSTLLKNNLATQNDALIRLYLALGFIPIAYTNTPEFGLAYTTEPQLFGPCKNPYDTSKTSGGSSGGSAAAVASGIVPIATASDGGGSIRVPAACCGLVGFKPSSHLLPAGPCCSESWSGMAVGFALGRTLRDLSRVFHEMIARISGPTLPIFATTQPHFIVAPGLFPSTPVARRWQQAVDTFLSALSQQGYTIEESTMRLDHSAIAACSLTLIKANVAAQLQRFAQYSQIMPTERSVEPITWCFYQDGLQLSASEFMIAKDRLFELLQPLHRLLRTGHVVVSPALAQDPVSLGEISMSDDYAHYLDKNTHFSPFTSLANQAGIPAISLPVHSDAALPLAVQLLMGKWRDTALLALCTNLKAQGLWRESAVITPSTER